MGRVERSNPAMRIARMRLFGLGALLVALVAPAASAQSALDQMQDAINQAASETMTSTQQSLDSIAPETPELNYADGACLRVVSQSRGRQGELVGWRGGSRWLSRCRAPTHGRSIDRPTDRLMYPSTHTRTAFEASGSVAKLKFLQDVQKSKKIDPAALFDEMVKSKAFSKVRVWAVQRPSGTG